MSRIDLEGLVPAIVVPMREDFGIDEETLKEYVGRIMNSGIKAIAVNTDAGEGQLLSQEERKQIVLLVRSIVKGKVPVVCGLGGASTSQVIEYAREFKDMGVDCFLVFPHFTFKGGPTKDAVIIKYHNEIAKVGVPMIIFELQESLGGTHYHFQTLEELVKIDGVIAIKEASFDALRFKETVSFLRAQEKKITILTGNDNFILESFILGADGALIGFGAIFTEIQVKAIQFVKDKKYQEALSLFGQIEETCQYCFSQPIRDYRKRIKEVLVRDGIFRNSLVRPPLL